MSFTLLIAGATGLIGKKTLELALADPSINKVIAPVRKKLPDHPKLEQWVDSDFAKALRPGKADAVICCLGTTIKKAGSKEAFRHVDHDLVITLGKWAKENGVGTFCVVSSMGADAGSSIFYNKVKGEMERDLFALQLPTLHIFHPSILKGPREAVRIGERIGIAAMSAFSFITPDNYKPMPYDTLAKALISASKIKTSGTYTYRKIFELAGR
ncbi:MAG: NAD(P)H-binding protein [Flavobacteriales bacterium]|nr:NAD(P)H-binding protein [Flavobacteriales bacterium]MBK6944082.1 NAD(P)H-binding protein [Flavobacteriales bacterium]MBK7240285.1 NAD(P)H-binding protein [Flavobacteriales bacterium]MBK7295425.1 NAD(P)H-binding protein [Flavobacteriales bacterium]MBK9533750.1 NAD(P)H-binding protein [Flavobacteriales bacterium]